MAKKVYLTPKQAAYLSAEKYVTSRKEQRRQAREIYDKALQRLLESERELIRAEIRLEEAKEP